MPLAILILAVVLTSLVSAYLSMRDYRDLPDRKHPYSLFLIRNLANFTPELLKQLYDDAKKHGIIISFERLFKGNQEALVIYAPKNLLDNYKELLGLLELEDYHEKLKERDVLSWELIPTSAKHNPLAALQESVLRLSLKNLSLKDEEQLIFQIVVLAVESKVGQSFQTSLRVAVVSAELSRRSELAHGVDGIFSRLTGFHKQKGAAKSSQSYGLLKKRGLVPKEISKFILNSESLIKLLK